MEDKAYLSHIYCKVKDRIQREKQIIQSDQDVHVYGLWWMEWKLLFCGLSLSLSLNPFESMAISSSLSLFFQDLQGSLSLFFLFFSWTHGPSWIFFFITHASFFLQ